jgi:hypothetical protein
MARKGYSFSRREIASHKCRDCGVNVFKVPAAIIREGADQEMLARSEAPSVVT